MSEITARINDAVVYGDVSDDILDFVFVIAHGQFREDMNFANRIYTGERFLEAMSTFARGVKDGQCILPGSVIDPPPGKRGVRRKAEHMKANCILMLDHDTGETMDEVAAKISALGLFALMWTTHSHMKPETVIPETKVLQWMKEKKLPSGGEPTHEQVIDCARETLKIQSKYLTGATVLGRELIEGGRKYRIKHEPLPRLRSLFILANDFDFATRAGSQKQVIEEWKARVAGFCENVLKVAYDTSCVDPSRLMYLPRIAEDADISQHEIRVLAGSKLDFDAVDPIVRGARAPSNPFTNAVAMIAANPSGGSAPASSIIRGDFKTTGLGKFLREHGDDFEAQDWLSHLDEDLQCPWADSHTAPEHGAKDTGFGVRNASQEDGNGFGMWCMHGCKSDLTRGMGENGKQDRAKYLDALCAKHGVKDAQELVSPDWTPNAEAKAAERQEQAAQTQAVHAQANAVASDDERIAGMVEALNEDTPVTQIDNVLRLLAMRPATDRMFVSRMTGRIRNNTGMPQADIRAAIVAHRRDFVQERTAATGGDGIEVVATQHNLPESVETCTAIWKDWHFKDQAQWTRDWFSYENRKDPRVFVHANLGVVRVEEWMDEKSRIVEMNPGRWAAELNRLLTFNQVVHEADGVRTERGVAPFKELVTEMANTTERPFPKLRRIIRVPIFGSDGVLRTQRGYDYDLQVWLDPDIEYLPVSSVPTEEEMDEAVGLLVEATCDFPFSDVFVGPETKPVKVGEIVKVGPPGQERDYMEQNYERGVSSRTHSIAAILLPFVRNMITSGKSFAPVPAFVIAKPDPGSGAGYLADVISIISEGARATAQPMSKENEEFRKSITATLKDGANLIFMDNISREVDSGDLAAALTAGVWRDRILGTTETIEIEMKAMWLFAGNKLSFSPENMRRCVPMMLNAAVENAAQSRGQEFFKHFPLQKWLFDNRPRLVWACHTIIQNWIARGKPDGGATLHSFDAFASVMSGILREAGLAGFLANIPSYLESGKTGEHDIPKQWAQACVNEFGLERQLTFKDMVQAANGGLFGSEKIELPIKTSRTEEGKIVYTDRAGHEFIRTSLVDKTFNLFVVPKGNKPSPENVRKVCLTVARGASPVKYAFSVVADR